MQAQLWNLLGQGSRALPDVGSVASSFGSRRDLMDLAQPPSRGRPRPRIRWEANHANGWLAMIVEQDDGCFVGWAARGEQRTSIFVSPDINHTHAAVMAFLARDAGHRKCTASCSDWRLRFRDEVRVA